VTGRAFAIVLWNAGRKKVRTSWGQKKKRRREKKNRKLENRKKHSNFYCSEETGKGRKLPGERVSKGPTMYDQARTEGKKEVDEKKTRPGEVFSIHPLRDGEPDIIVFIRKRGGDHLRGRGGGAEGKNIPDAEKKRGDGFLLLLNQKKEEEKKPQIEKEITSKRSAGLLFGKGEESPKKRTNRKKKQTASSRVALASAET